ncbi:hypothetical protein LINPERHAP2_LOCUS31162 [Linum perenne]
MLSPSRKKKASGGAAGRRGGSAGNCAEEGGPTAEADIGVASETDGGSRPRCLTAAEGDIGDGGKRRTMIASGTATGRRGGATIDSTRGKRRSSSSAEVLPTVRELSSDDDFQRYGKQERNKRQKGEVDHEHVSLEDKVNVIVPIRITGNAQLTGIVLVHVIVPIRIAWHYNMFVVNRRDKQYEFLDSKYPRDLEVKWRPTADRVVQYATSYFRNCVVWEGKVEDYMLHEWIDKDYGKNRRDDICLALLNSKDNSLFSEVNEAATKMEPWNGVTC